MLSKLCLKCKQKKSMKNFDVCFDCYMGISKPLNEIIIEERKVNNDVFD